jgi:PKD repeat protein
VKWDFGVGSSDPSTDNNLTPSFAYRQRGTFKVTAAVTGQGGKQATAMAHVTISGVKPVAIPGVTPAKGIAGRPLNLIDNSSGDIAKQTWVVDGDKVPEGTLSAAINRSGLCDVSLIVEGAPDESGKSESDSATIKILVLSVQLLIAATLAGVIAVCLGIWLILLCRKNEPRNWVVWGGVTNAEDKQNSQYVSTYWERRGKFADVPLSEIFYQLDYWRDGAGKETCVRVQESSVDENFPGQLSVAGALKEKVHCTEMSKNPGTRYYKLTDSRCKDEKAGQKVFLHVERRKSAGARWTDALGLLAGIVLTTAGLASILFVAYWVW